MRHTNKFLPLLFALTLGGRGARADQPFSEGMVSITFDDGGVTQYTLGRPALGQHGYHATFYLISDYLTWGEYVTVDEARQLAADGHEIGSHTKTHPNLTTVSDAQLAWELSQSQSDLVTNLGLPDVEDFAAPYGAYDNRTLAAAWQYYLSHRNTITHTNFRETSHYHLGGYDCSSATTVDEVQGLIDRALAERSWLILYLHDLTTGAPAPSSNQFQVSSFNYILDYLTQRNVTVVTVREGLALMNVAPSVPPRTPVDAAWLLSWATMSEPVVIDGRYAQRFAEAVGDTHHLLDNYSADRASGAWELTTVAHADTRTGLFLRLSPGGAPDVRAAFDLSQGIVRSVTADGTAATASIDDLGEGWYRCRLVVASPITPSHADVGLLDGTGAQAYLGDGSSGLYLSEATLAPPAPPPAVSHFSVDAPASVAAGNVFSFTVTALDNNNNTVAGYSGNVHFTSTDGQAILPADSTLTNGIGTFSATLTTAGNQILTAADSATSSITGTSSIINVSAGLYALTVNLAGTGSGIVTTSQQGLTGFACTATACSGSYAPGTSVTLTAVPDTTSSFSGWSGACSGKGNCTVTMTGLMTVTATFAHPPQYLVTVTRSGSGSGTVSSTPDGIACGSTCSVQYDSGTTVALWALADAGSTFGGWSGACSGTKNCRFTVTGDVSVGAAFKLATYALKVSLSGNGKGSVSVNPPGATCSSNGCSYSYPANTRVSLSATTRTGYRFAGWSGACTGSGLCDIIMDSAQSVTATFAR